MKSFDEFQNLYSLSKTLKFELQPQGKTLHYIRKNGLLEDDQKRADSYKIVKKVVDAYHRKFIDDYLVGIELDKIKEYDDLFGEKTADKKRSQDAISLIEKDLRKQIIEYITKKDAALFKDIFAKELFKKDILTDFVKDDDNLYIDEVLKELKITSKSELLQHIDVFKQFTTYFGGFHENRKNVYSKDDIPTSIAHRIAHDNLPKYIVNRRIIIDFPNNDEFAKIFNKIETELQDFLADKSIEQFFSLENYSNNITQKQIEIYNTIIGGLTKKDGTKIQGLNEHINLYNQAHTGKDKDQKPIPKLRRLFKQILSKRSEVSFIPKQYDDDKELLSSISEFYSILHSKCLYPTEKGEISIIELINQLDEFELDSIYIKNNDSITSISNYIFGNWAIIPNALREYYDTTKSTLRPAKNKLKYNKITKIPTKSYEVEKDRFFRNEDGFSIDAINKSLDLYLNPKKDDISSDDTLFLKEDRNIDKTVKKKNDNNKNDIDDAKKKWAELGSITNFFKKWTIKRKKDNVEVDIELIGRIEQSYIKVKDVLEKEYPYNNLNMDSQAKEKIKLYLDSVLNLQHFLRPFVVKIEAKDNNFYNTFEPLYEVMRAINPLYDKVRNYLTRKPNEIEKLKLNFEKSTLLNGWDVNQESANLSVILKKNDYFYLAIMHKNQNKSFDLNFSVDSDYYEKMQYKLLAGPNKMLPKVFFSKSRIDEFNPTEEILENYNNKTHNKGANFNLNHCHKLIDFFKDAISRHPDWKHFNFKFSPTESYEDISKFYREVHDQGYKMNFRKIPVSYIDQLVEDGKLYLFKIYNKDFSQYTNGKPNLHTTYWKKLFDQENLNDVVYQLNGEAEMFYRKASIAKDNIFHHPANEPIDNKNVLNNKKTSTFNYDLVKDKRFTTEKFHFHVPITLNFKATGAENINLKVKEYLQQSYNTHVIGIDRGERHLLYLSVIDRNGIIVEQFSLNEIINTYKDKDMEDIQVINNYKNLLDNKEKDRTKAKQNWQAIGNIKELKEGYLSQVVHLIATMMVKYNAIVVLEDLNMGFKNSRIKVDKQVYQKFERRLIEKLNYLVFKDIKATEPGGALHAYQLSSKLDSFKTLGKQCGFLFYIPAWMTSKIDPMTGFTVLFNHKELNYESVEKSQLFFNKFKNIRFNSIKDYFEFEFDYSDFTTKAEGTKTKWTVCADGDRIKTFRNPEKNNEWDNIPLKLTDEFIKLLDKYSIIYADGKDLKEQINAKGTKDFFFEFYKLFSLTLQMRNSITGTNTDYLISPVVDEKTGVCYDSRKTKANLPDNADANGAYNIARKGLMLLHRINKSNDLKKTDLFISNKQWLAFAQGDENWMEIKSDKS